MGSVHTERVALHDAARSRYGLPHPLALAVLVIMMFGVTFATSAGAAAAEPSAQRAAQPDYNTVQVIDTETRQVVQTLAAGRAFRTGF